VDDQKDHAEEASNRADMQREGAAELAAETASGKTREDAERYVVETIAADRIITDDQARAEFNVEAIITELQKLTGDYDFDEITTDQFMEIVAKHDNTTDERTQAEKSDPNFRTGE
jgi:hypothetical protein